MTATTETPVGPDGESVDKGLVRLRAQALRSGLGSLAEGDPGGAASVRRMAKALVSWARDSGLGNLEDAAFRVEVSPDTGLAQAADTLLSTLENVLTRDDANIPGPAHVLVAVEADRADAALLESTLHSPDRNLRIVSSVSDAASILEREKADLLILDLVLPDADGRDLLLNLRKRDRYRGLPILILSAGADDEAKTECLALGADALFAKPLDPPVLAAAVASHLHRGAARKHTTGLDALTGLLDRPGARRLWTERSFPDPTALALLGVDRFAGVRDRFGEATSAAVLQSVATLLGESLPHDCVCARWGGAEFMILAPGLDGAGMGALLKQVLEKLRGMEHPDPRGERFGVTASGGVAALGPGTHVDAAVLEAEGRMAWAARTGGDTLAQEPVPSDQVTVLLAEDEPLSAGILQHRLENDGFKVLHYPDGLQAMDGAMAHRVSLAILDVKMPGMDGFELLGRLRREPAYQDLPIMMLTSLSREEDVVRGFRLGADDYMVKPFSPVEVAARARRLLKR